MALSVRVLCRGHLPQFINDNGDKTITDYLVSCPHLPLADITGVLITDLCLWSLSGDLGHLDPGHSPHIGGWPLWSLHPGCSR